MTGGDAIAIVESRADSASVHVCERLRELADWEVREDGSLPNADGGGTYYRTAGFELRSFDDLHLELERPAAAFDVDPDLLVFASRHAGETGPLLTGHFTGNFGPAEYGGDDRALAEAAPNALARLLDAFDERAPAGYDVGMECTHHGPTDVGCPSLFAELGSGEEQWADPAGARAVARAILDLEGVAVHGELLESDALSSRRKRSAIPRRQVVGFGGGHYVPRFERVVRETPWAVGHVASSWALEAMGDPDGHRELVQRAFEASRAEIALLEGDRPTLERVVADLGYRVASETWLREVGDRPLALVDRVESTLGAVADGVRFGARRDDSFEVVDLPGELVDEAEGIDPDRVRAIVAERVVAFETENGASRVGDRAALPAPARAALESIVEELAGVLEEKYEAVRIEETRDGDRLEEMTVVAEERAFDPELAREAGVPEGPKFGALANGSPVAVDGETVEPADVRVERTRRFPIPFERP